MKKGPKPRELHAQGGTVPLPGQPNIPHSRVELMLSAKNLKDKDVLSKSDPLCVVYSVIDRGDKQEPNYFEIGRTEVIFNNLNPQWNTKIQLDYFFESKQLLRFDIFDIDTADSKDLSRHDFLGRCETTLADIVASIDGALTLKLSSLKQKDDPKQHGELIVRAEEVDKGQKEILYLICHGRKVASPGICSCCFGVDPFLEFHRIYSNEKGQMVHRTEVQNSINPEFNPIEINVRHLCEGDRDREFMIQCLNYKLHGKHEFLGQASLTVNQLTQQNLVRSVPLVRKGSKQMDGSLQFLEVECKREYTWLDFVKGGMQLEFAVSVDFTSSNGNITLPTSRHYVDQFCLNQYELAIKSVLEVCEHYNTTKIFETFGFGAIIKGHAEALHLFPLDIDNWQPAAHGVKGVMDAYRNALTRVDLHGPTNFEPTIRHILQKCRGFSRDGSKYQILLIITDGLITDMERTKVAIIEASDQPLSIIIIGVGDEDFAKMEELDSDSIRDVAPDSMLKYKKMTAKRDIVQFVPFHNYYGAVASVQSKLTPYQQSQIQAELAKAVLEEIPYQVTSYCKMHNIHPKNINPPPILDH